jgi:hypothetical protein
LGSYPEAERLNFRRSALDQSQEDPGLSKPLREEKENSLSYMRPPTN